MKGKRLQSARFNKMEAEQRSNIGYLAAHYDSFDRSNALNHSSSPSLPVMEKPASLHMKTNNWKHRLAIRVILLMLWTPVTLAILLGLNCPEWGFTSVKQSNRLWLDEFKNP